jgi:DNA-binding response OmpR family regulator
MIDRKDPPRLEGARVLIVEDEYLLADDLVRALGARGVDVVGPVATLDGAARLVEQERIDGAIVDINLRGEMAYPIADRLSAAGIPFVIASGYGRTNLPERFAGVPHVEKPFDVEAVLALLPKAVGRGVQLGPA